MHVLEKTGDRHVVRSAFHVSVSRFWYGIFALAGSVWLDVLGFFIFIGATGIFDLGTRG
jgi:hypothetical protein